MEIENTIDIDDFMSLFTAVSYLQEQRFFNIFNLKNYLKSQCGVTTDELSSVDMIIDQMVEAGIINHVTNSNGLFKISKKIPFKEIIFERYDKLNEMINFFYNYNSFDFASSKIFDDIPKNTSLKK